MDNETQAGTDAKIARSTSPYRARGAGTEKGEFGTFLRRWNVARDKAGRGEWWQAKVDNKFLEICRRAGNRQQVSVCWRDGKVRLGSNVTVVVSQWTAQCLPLKWQ